MTNQRLLDLVRYCRHELHKTGLITDLEFAELVAVDGAPARLEDYDAAKRTMGEQARAMREVLEEENPYSKALALKPTEAELTARRNAQAAALLNRLLLPKSRAMQTTHKVFFDQDAHGTVIAVWNLELTFRDDLVSDLLEWAKEGGAR